MKKNAKILLAVCSILALSGCDSLNKLYDHDHKKDPPYVSGVYAAQPIRPLTIIAAGQSNADSFLRGERERGYSVTGRVDLKRRDFSEWMQPTVQNPSDRAICWIYCADILAVESGRRIHIVDIAEGNSSTRDWVNTHAATLANAVEDNRADAVVWVQGESDYWAGISEEESYQNMKAIIGRVKSRRNIPFFIALNSVGEALDAYSDRNQIPIRRAQMRLINESIAQRGPDTDTLRDNYPTDPGRVHFINEGIEAHGRLWAEVLTSYGL